MQLNQSKYLTIVDDVEIGSKYYADNVCHCGEHTFIVCNICYIPGDNIAISCCQCSIINNYVKSDLIRWGIKKVTEITEEKKIVGKEIVKPSKSKYFRWTIALKGL